MIGVRGTNDCYSCLESTFDIVTDGQVDTGYSWYFSGGVLGVGIGRVVVQEIRYWGMKFLFQSLALVRKSLFWMRLSQVLLTKFICSNQNNVFIKPFD